MDFGDILRQWETSSRIRGSEGQERKKGRESGKGEAGRGTGCSGPGSRESRESGDLQSRNCTESGEAEEETGPDQDPVVSPTARYLTAWLATHTIPDKDASDTGPAGSGQIASHARSRREQSRQSPDATLDLHGKTVSEAVALVYGFLERCAREGKEHVLIIHGKGMHSADGPVLDGVVRKVLETSPVAGMHGEAHRSLGGRGATWVRIRRRDYFSR